MPNMDCPIFSNIFDNLSSTGNSKSAAPIPIVSQNLQKEPEPAIDESTSSKELLKEQMEAKFRRIRFLKKKLRHIKACK